MFDIGFGELILLAAIALIALGPKQLPEVARVAGRFINDMRRIAREFTGSIVNARDSTDGLFSGLRDDIRGTTSRPVPKAEAPAATVPTTDPTRSNSPAAAEESDRARQMSFPLFDPKVDEPGAPRG